MSERLQRAGLDALIRRTAALRSVRVRFGSMGPNGGRSLPHPGSSLNTAEVLQIHEFGLGVPERPVVRAVVHGKRDELAAALKSAAAAALKGASGDPVESVGRRAAELLVEAHDALGFVVVDGEARHALDETGAIRRSLGWAHDEGDR